MKTKLCRNLLLLICCSMLTLNQAQAETRVIRGAITLVEFDQINIGNQLYPLKPILRGVDMRKALGTNVSSAAFAVEVWNGDSELSYETLQAIGYVTEAEVVLVDGEVSSIKILRMEQ